MEYEYCRLCLAEEDLNSINDQVKTIIYNELKIDIEKHKDLLSIEICVTCCEFLTKINIFKTKVLKKQSLLLKILNVDEINNTEPKTEERDEVPKSTSNQKQLDATDWKKQGDSVVVQAWKFRKNSYTENEEVTSNKSRSRRSEINTSAEVMNNSHEAAVNSNPTLRIKKEPITEAGNITTNKEVTPPNDPFILVNVKAEPGTAKETRLRADETKSKKKSNTENEEVTSNKSKSPRSEINTSTEVMNNSHEAAVNLNLAPRIKRERITEADEIANNKEVTPPNNPFSPVNIKKEPVTANQTRTDRTNSEKKSNSENKEVISNKSWSRRFETNTLAEVVNNSHEAAVNSNLKPRIKTERISKAGDIATNEEVTPLDDPIILVNTEAEPGTANHPCGVCAKSFGFEESLNNHYRRHHSDIFKCHYCQYFTKFRKTFKKHMKEHAVPSTKIPWIKCLKANIFICIHCKRDFDTKKSFNYHIKKCRSISLSETNTCGSSDTDANAAPLPEETNLQHDNRTKKSKNSAIKSTNTEKISVEPHPRASSSTESSRKRSIPAEENVKIKRVRFSTVDKIISFEYPPKPVYPLHKRNQPSYSKCVPIRTQLLLDVHPRAHRYHQQRLNAGIA